MPKKTAQPAQEQLHLPAAQVLDHQGNQDLEVVDQIASNENDEHIATRDITQRILAFGATSILVASFASSAPIVKQQFACVYRSSMFVGGTPRSIP